MTVQVKIDQQDLNRLRSTMAFIGKSANPVMARAINKTMTNTQTFAIGKIYGSLNLTKTRIRKDFSIFRAIASRVSGNVKAKGNPIGLISFSGTKELKKGGVSYKIYRSRKEKPLEHAFIAETRSEDDFGNVSVWPNVWERVHYKGRKWNPRINYAALRKIYGDKPYAIPLHRMTGPRIEDEYAKDKILNPTLKNAGERLTVNIKSQLDYEWSKI